MGWKRIAGLSNTAIMINGEDDADDDADDD